VKAWSDFISLVYPRVCSGCGNALFRHENTICNHCYVSLPRSNFHLQPQNPVQKIFMGRAEVGFASSFLLFEKKGRVQKLLHALKYRSRPEVGYVLGSWYGQDLKKSGAFADCQLIVPVPLHRNRLRKRGYNQSEWIARGLAGELGLGISTGALQKKVFTETQTFKSREERWQNTMESFALADASELAGRHVLLVDDVITTGATTEACIFQLHKAGASAVSVASIAYTI
jgi:ComF family protein